MAWITPYTFTNPNALIDLFYGDQIKTTPSLVNWIQGDTASTVLNGAKIASFSDLGGKTLTLSQGDSTRQATLGSGQFNGQSAAVFDGANTRYPYAGGWVRGQPWTVVTLSKVPVGNNDFGPVIFCFDTVPVQTGIAHSNGSMNLRHGSGQIVAPVTNGQSILTIMSSDTATLRGRVNGVTQTPSPTDNAVTANGAIVGALNDFNGQATLRGSISDIMIFSENIFNNAKLLSIVEGYFTSPDTYGLPFEPFAN